MYVQPAFVIVVTVATTVAILALLAMFVVHIVDFNFMDAAACKQLSGSRFWSKHTYCFYSEEWNEETFLAAVSGFYSTLITVLIAAQAIITWFAFVVLRGSHKTAIEEEVENELPRYFDRRTGAQALTEVVAQLTKRELKAAVEKASYENKNKLAELERRVSEEHQSLIEELQLKVEELENSLENGAMLFDNDEPQEGEDV
ncbi:hypothetical protein BWR17_15665 [Phaeobacter inhibens]|nr:hypothetical protein BWR17_15665 [Phaeobacter inhibens]